MGHGAAGCILEEALAVSAPQAQRQAIWRPGRTGQGRPCVPGPQPIPCDTATYILSKPGQGAHWLPGAFLRMPLSSTLLGTSVCQVASTAHRPGGCACSPAPKPDICIRSLVLAISKGHQRSCQSYCRAELCEYHCSPPIGTLWR